MASGFYELQWLNIITEDLRIEKEGTMRLYRYNKSAINIDHNPVQHYHTKQIEVDGHFIKVKLDCGLISTLYTPTKDQLAN